MKRAVQSAMRMGAQGIRVRTLGPPGRRRDRARPRGTARAGCRCTRCAPTSTTRRATAKTTYGTIGVKVWIFKGEVVEDVTRPHLQHGGLTPMLAPKRIKFRKQFKGRTKGHRAPAATRSRSASSAS